MDPATVVQLKAGVRFKVALLVSELVPGKSGVGGLRVGTMFVGIATVI